MNLHSPRLTLIIGFILALLGVALPILMLLNVLSSSFWLSFFSYTAIILGQFLGLIGAVSYIQINRRM